MKVTLADQITQSIKKDIWEGKLKPTVFLTEGGVAQKFGVSKAPVRTALHRLCDEGFLINYARKGYLVTNQSEVDHQNIKQLRFAIEKLSISSIILTVPDQEIKKLKEIALLETPNDKRYATVNEQFHMAMAVLSNNRFLVRTLEDLFGELSLTYNYASISYTIPLEQQNYHLQLVEALLARDEAEAIRWLRQDLAPKQNPNVLLFP